MEVESFLENNDYIYMPVYLYDHSGLRISTMDFDDRWDSGFFGCLYISKEQIRKDYEVKRISKKTLQKVYEHMSSLINNEWNTYISGEVYGYCIFDKNDDYIAGSSGFYSLECIEKELEYTLDVLVS